MRVSEYVSLGMAATLMSVSQMEQALLRSSGQHTRCGLANLAFSVTLPSAVVAGSWLGRPETIMLAYVLAESWFIIPALRGVHCPLRLAWWLKKERLRYILPGWMAGVLSVLAWGQTEVSILYSMLGHGAVLVFFQSSRIASIIPQVFTAQVGYVSPKYAKAFAEHSSTGLRQLIIAGTMTGMFIQVPIAMVLAFTSSSWVPMIAGKEVGQSWGVFAVMLLIAGGTTSLHSAICLRIAGGSHITILCYVVALSVLVLACVMLVPRFGLGGVLISRWAGQILGGYIEVFAIHMRYGLLKMLLAILGVHAGLIGVAVGIVAMPEWLETDWNSLILASLTLAVWLTIMWFWRKTLLRWVRVLAGA